MFFALHISGLILDCGTGFHILCQPLSVTEAPLYLTEVFQLPKLPPVYLSHEGPKGF